MSAATTTNSTTNTTDVQHSSTSNTNVGTSEGPNIIQLRDNQRSPHPSDTTNNTTTNTRAVDRRHSIFPDPRGSVVDEEDDIELHTSIPSSFSPAEPVQQHNIEQLVLLPPFGEPPPPYPGLPRSLTAHLRQTDETVRRSQPGRQQLFLNSTQTRVTANMTMSNHSSNIPIARSYEVYKKDMNSSLFMLLLCLILFNPLSLFITVPAVILSWKTITFVWKDNYRVAEKFRKAAQVLNIIVVVQYIVIIVISLLVIGIYMLVQHGNVTVKFNF